MRLNVYRKKASNKEHEFSSVYEVNYTDAGTLDVEGVDTYKKCYLKDNPRKLYPCSITVRQRYSFEKQSGGWILVGRSLHYEGYSSLEVIAKQEKMRKKEIKDKKRERKDKKQEEAVDFDSSIFEQHLAGAKRLIEKVSVSEEGLTRHMEFLKSAMKKTNLAYKMLERLSGEERQAAEEQVLVLWNEWKVKHRLLVLRLESDFVPTPSFTTDNLSRLEDLNKLFEQHVLVLEKIRVRESSARDLIEYVDTIQKLDSVELNKKIADYMRLMNESKEILKRAGRESGSPLAEMMKKLDLDDKEKEEVKRVSGNYFYLQQAIQGNFELVMGVVMKLHEKAIVEERKHALPLPTFTRGSSVDAAESSRSSETSPASSRPHSQTRRYSTGFNPLRLRTRSLTNLFSVNPSKGGSGKPKKGKKNKKPTKGSQPVSHEDSGSERSTPSSEQAGHTISTLRSLLYETAHEDPRKHRRHASAGLVPLLSVNPPESSTVSSQPDLSLDPGETSLDYQDSGLGLRSTASSNARSLESSRSSSFSNQPGSLPSGSDSMVVDSSRSPSENGVLEELAPRRRRVQALSTVFSEEGDNPLLESDLDVLFSRASYREGSSVTLNEDAQLSRSLDDLNALRSPGTRRPTTSDSGRSITEELTEQWDDLLASQTPTGPGSPSRRNVKAEIEEIIRENVTPLSQPSMTLARSLYRVVARHGNISALAASLDPSGESITGWNEMDNYAQLELLSELLIEFLQDGTGDSLAGTIDRLYGESFVEEYINQISEGLSGSAQ